jgi:hypothetical protein
VHAQATSGTEPGHPAELDPGNSPRRPTVRPAGDYLLSRRDTGCLAMTGARQSLLIPRTGVSDGPQPPQSQQLPKLTELLRTPRPFHGSCVLSQEPLMVALRQHGEDPDRAIRIHDHQPDAQSQPTPFSACLGLLPTLARAPSVFEEHPRRAPALPAAGQRSRSPDGDLRPTRRLHSAVGTRSRIDLDQGAPNPAGSPASRRGTGASMAYERVLSQIALPLALPGPAGESRP